MRKIIFLLAVLCSGSAFAQKVDVKDNVITVDEKPYAKIERIGGTFSPEIYFEVTNLSTGKKLMRISLQKIFIPEEKSPSNPDGSVVYSKYMFYDSARHIRENKVAYLKDEKMAKQIVRNNLIVDGALNEEEVLNFVTENGTPFSDRNTIKVRF